MPTAAELIFKIQAQGISELQKVEAVVKTVGEGTRLAGAQLKTFDSTLQSLVSTGKTYTQALEQMAASNGVLSQSIRGTASDLLLQAKAASGDEDAIRKLTGVTEGLAAANSHAVSQIAATSGAIRVMEGAMPIRAVENLLAKTLGLGPVFQAAFPIFGAVAMGEVLVHVGEKVYELYQKWDSVAAAEKRATDAAKEYGNTVHGVKDRIQAQENELFGLRNGRPAMLAREAGQAADRAAQDRRNAGAQDALIKEAQDAIAAATAMVNAAPSSLIGGGTGTAGTGTAAQAARALIEAQANLHAAQIHKLEFENKARQDQNDADIKSEEYRKAREAEDKKNDRDDARGERPYDTARRQADAILERAQLSELSGLQKINRERDDEIKKFEQWPDLIARVSQAFDILTAKEEASETARGNALGRRIRDDISKRVEEMALIGEHAGFFSDKLASQYDPSIPAVANAGPSAPANAGSFSGASPQDRLRNLQQMAKAQEALLKATGATQEDQDNHRLAIARQVLALEKEIADIRFAGDDKAEARAQAERDAEANFEQTKLDIQLRNLAAKEQQSAKDKALASELTSIAMSRNPSGGFHQWGVQQLHGLASGVAGNVFGSTVGTALNGISGPLQAAGMGDLLKGTILDRSGVTVQDKIEANTRRTADNIAKLTTGGAVASDGTVSPSPANLASDGLPLSDVRTFGSDISGWTGSGVNPLAKLLGLGGSAGGSSNGILSGLSAESGNFSAGAGGALSGNALATIFGENTTGPTTLSAQIGAGVGLGGALAAGGLGIASGISQGGIGGDMKAAGSAAGIAGMLTSNIAKLVGAVSPALTAIPIIGSIAAMALPLIGDLFGNNPAKRAQQISNELGSAQYLAPTAWNVSQGPGGTYADFDARGNFRNSSMSAVPTVAEPYTYWSRLNGAQYATPINAPGNVLAPFSGSAAGTGQAPTSNAPTTIVIQALDSQSFHDYLQKPGPNAALGAGVTTHLQNSGERLADAIKYHVGNN